MIEITHKQAQHLIREGLERRLPDAQWAMLQSHLENCAECSAYKQRLTATQRGLTHALRLRWSAARGPRPGTTQYLMDLRARRAKQRVWIVRGARFALVVLLLAAYITYRRLSAPPPPVVQPTLGASLAREATLRALTATPEPVITYRGLIAFEEHRDGSSDIILLNASGGQVDRSNLTQSPAAESHPAWSPDGEWIAFLSDRSGKNEIYMMTVAGSRLTQITDQPDIDWQGPLEWSYDGSRIALTGRRADSSADTFLYLVPTDGSAPQSIAYTRGAQPWSRFSPALPLLAFPSVEQDGGLSVINIETGWTTRVTAEDTDLLRYSLIHPEAFDWSLGGRSLVYTVNSENSALVRLSPELDAVSTVDFDGSGAQNIASGPVYGFSGVTWVPSSLLVASLENNPDGCRTIRLDHAYNRQVAPRRLPGLCVEGSLERASWSGDGNWLALLARLPDESTPSIYAVRLPADNEAPLFERLGDVNLIARGSDSLPVGPALRVRKIGRHLAINPRPAAEPPQGPPVQFSDVLPPAVEELPEWLVYAVDTGAAGQIFRGSLDSPQFEPLTGTEAVDTCPRIGPDGRVAYLSDMGRGETVSREIFVMDGDGQNHNLLTPEGGNRIYDCPVWSPDGQFLAAFNHQEGESSLAVIRADGSEPPFFLPVERSGLSAPVWLPNDPADPSLGADRVLVIVPQARQPVRLLEYDLSLPEGERETPRELAIFPGWDDVWGAALSPDGTRLAMVQVLYNRSNARFVGRTSAQLRVIDLQTMVSPVSVQLNNFDPYTVGRGGLSWLSETQLGLVRSTSMIGSQKSVFEIFGPTPNGLQSVLRTVTHFEDIVFSADWISSPDGTQGWILFTAESGLWALTYGPDGASLPVQFSGAVISGADW